MHVQLGQIMANKLQKDQNNKQTNQLPLLKNQEQKQGPVQAPCTQYHHKGGQTTSATHPSRPLPPQPHIRNQLTPPSGSEQGDLLLVFRSLLLQQGPQ